MPDLDVLVLGMMMGEVSPPRAGTSFGDGRGLVLFPSGSATIFAIALARLGARVGLLSRVGDDPLGAWMREQATTAGIDTAVVGVVSGQQTPLALASVDREGRKTYSFYRYEGRCDPLATLRAAEVPDDLLRRARVFDFGEASLRSPHLREETLTLARRARELGAAICYTPNYRAAAWSGGAAEASTVQRQAVALATVTLMNREEAQLLSGEPDPESAVRALLHLGPQIVIVTGGADGALVATAAGNTPIPAVPVRVVFDIGAGDTFHAGFLATWQPGGDPIPAARFATHAAALKIAQEPLPELVPTREDVLAALQQAGR
ncbi:MAG: PfkB family carbohydrate kinase [Thermomicrobiales bacterium]